MEKVDLAAAVEQIIKMISPKEKYETVSLRSKEKARFLMWRFILLVGLGELLPKLMFSEAFCTNSTFSATELIFRQRQPLIQI